MKTVLPYPQIHGHFLLIPNEPSWHMSLQNDNARPSFTKSHFQSCARERHRKQPTLRGCIFDFHLHFDVKGWALSLGFQSNLSGESVAASPSQRTTPKTGVLVFQLVLHACVHSNWPTIKQIIREFFRGWMSRAMIALVQFLFREPPVYYGQSGPQRARGVTYE